MILWTPSGTAYCPDVRATTGVIRRPTHATMEDDGFHATLAFLAEFDASDDDVPRRQSAASPMAPPVSTAAVATPKSRAKTKSSAKSSAASMTAAAAAAVVNAAPKTRKEELEFLRIQVQELEEKLRMLRDRKGHCGQSRASQEAENTGALAVMGTVTTKPRRIASMWEELAMRQYQQRQQAEVENLKLKSMLEDQLKVAKGLQRMLHKSKCDVLENHVKRAKRLESETSAADNAVVFDELSTTVMDMSRHVDAAFADDRFTTADVEFRDVSVSQDAANGTSVDVHNAKMVPFPVHQTAGAIWECFIHESMDTQGFYVQDVELTDDTVMKSIRVELQVHRYFSRLRARSWVGGLLTTIE